MKKSIFLIIILAGTFGLCQGILPPTGENLYFKEANLYLLGPKDIVNIVVFGEPQLSGDYEINDEGKIKFPLLGEVAISNLTVQQAAEKIEKLLEKDYFVDAQVSLVVKEYKSFWVNVIGEVKNEGRKYLKNKATILDVISECGGLSQEAGDSITLKRPVNKDSSLVMQLTLKDLTNPNSQYFNFKVEPGDTIIVHQKPYFYIQGEVAKPGKYELANNLTLLQAIALAGGIGKYANEKNVEIYRTEGSETKIIKKNLKEIKKNEEEDIIIQPMDTIIVNKRTF
jgi:polysaccharide export outer membrane protein